MKESKYEGLKYCIELDCDTLCAYDRETEFLAFYISEKKQWERVNIPISVFRHDRYYEDISEEEALERTNGISPEKLFNNYLEIIRRSRGI